MTKPKNYPKPTSPQDPNLPVDRWAPYTRKLPYGTIRTGYKPDEKNPLLLVPDVEQIFWLEQAFDHLQNGVSLREAAEWCSQKMKKNVAHATLNTLYKNHRKPYTFKKTLKREGVKHDRDTKKLIAEKNKARAAVRRAVVAEEKARLKKLGTIPEDKWEMPREEKAPVDKTFSDTPDKFKIKVAFEPTEKQKEFLSATEFEVLYGGAAGGEDKVFLPPPFAVMRQNKTRELLECPRRENQQPSFCR